MGLDKQLLKATRARIAAFQEAQRELDRILAEPVPDDETPAEREAARERFTAQLRRCVELGAEITRPRVIKGGKA